MKIALGKKGNYSVRAVLDLARHYGRGRRKTQEIATSMEIPEKYLARILADLVRCDLLTAHRGGTTGRRNRAVRRQGHFGADAARRHADPDRRTTG